MIEATEIRRRIYGKLETLGLKDQKEDIVFNFTAGRTSHLSAMDDEELLSLLEKLGGHVTDNNNIAWGKFDQKSKQHMYLLSMCQQLGWLVYSQKHGRNIADIARLGRWIRNFGQVKRPLVEQSREECQKTIYQFEEMVRKHFAK